MFMSISRKFLSLHDIQLSIFSWNLIHWDSEKLFLYTNSAVNADRQSVYKNHSFLHIKRMEYEMPVFDNNEKDKKEGVSEIYYFNKEKDEKVFIQ